MDDRFDRAVSALIRVQSARHYGSGIPRELFPGDDDQHQKFKTALFEEGIRNFSQQLAESKFALSELAGYIPEVNEWVTQGWEIDETQDVKWRELIQNRRESAVRTERLFRTRRLTDDHNVEFPKM